MGCKISCISNFWILKKCLYLLQAFFCNYNRLCLNILKNRQVCLYFEILLYIWIVKNSIVKNRIIETASSLFYKNGYNSTGINEIISESGIAKATLYNHFKYFWLNLFTCSNTCSYPFTPTSLSSTLSKSNKIGNLVWLVPFLKNSY